ncbi:MAG: carbohydrate porin [Gammaproteobacteria bacterium]
MIWPANRGFALDVTDRFSVNGVAAVSMQCQHASNADDKCRGAAPIQPEFRFQPDQQNEFLVKLGFAAGNGLNKELPANVSPWGADLEDDVTDINGRDRSYLLTAWYKHTADLGAAGDLELTAGIIDATDYLDQNRYSNDEYTQFMNSALVNAPSALLPSYDAGVAADWQIGSWSLTGVMMQVGEDDAGKNYGFLGVQAERTVDLSIGPGTYRVVLAGTSNDFPRPDTGRDSRRRWLLISIDQQFAPNIGGFMRVGWQDDDAAIDYKALYSAGIDFDGALWNRSGDNLGVAYAWLRGGNLDIDNSHVGEAYYRFAVSAGLSFTADLQFISEKVDNGDGPEGWIPGIRTTFEF